MDDLFKPKNALKDEKFLRFIYVAVIHSPALKLWYAILVFSFIFQIIINVVQILEMSKNLDSMILIEYGPFLLLSNLGLMNIAVIMMKWDFFLNLIKTIFTKGWAIDDRSKPRFIRDSVNCFLCRASMEVVVITALIYFNPFCLNHPPFTTYFYGIYVLRRNPSILTKILSIVCFMVVVIICEQMMTIPFSFQYIAHHMRYQLVQANYRFSQISTDYDKFDDYSLIRDRSYQRKIKRRLRLLIRHFEFVKRIEIGLNDMLYTVVGVVLGALVLFFVTVILMILSNTDYSQLYIGIGLLCIAGFFPAFIFVYCVQNLRSESEKTFRTACDTRWTSWDPSNRKTLIFLLMNLREPLSIRIYGRVECNYELYTQLAKFTFSVATVIHKFTSVEP